MVDALFAAGVSGFREGNLLGLLKPLYDRIDNHFASFADPSGQTLISQIQSESFKRAVRDFIKRELDRLNHRRPWLDKTCNCEAILVVPDLIEMWPKCRIIFARRRAIENIQSRLIKFSERDFKYHCLDWARNMSGWRRIRDSLEPWRYVEIDQRDVILRPETVAQAIASLLALDDETIARMKGAFVRLRPQQTAPGTAERVTALDKTGWTRAQMADFNQICGPEMQAYGYSLDRDYWTA